MKTLAWIMTLALLVACGDKPESASPKGAAPKGNTELDAAMASAPLGKGISVAESRAKKTADEILVVGRINKIVNGYAAFQMTDLELEYCGQTVKEDDCKTPWDYCCIANDEQKANRISVAIYGMDGGILRALTNMMM